MDLLFLGAFTPPSTFRFSAVVSRNYRGHYRPDQIKDMPEYPFRWGDRSIGSQRLAYMMLLAVTDAPLVCCDLKDKFLDQVVAKLPLSEWEMSEADVLRWIVQEMENAFFSPPSPENTVDLREESIRA
jgi:hypothetical protein